MAERVRISGMTPISAWSKLSPADAELKPVIVVSLGVGRSVASELPLGRSDTGNGDPRIGRRIRGNEVRGSDRSTTLSFSPYGALMSKMGKLEVPIIGTYP